MTIQAFQSVPYAAPDAMFALQAAHEADPSPKKINLGPGAYKSDEGKNWILPCVREAEKRLIDHPPGHEYLPLLGLPAFTKGAREVIFGKSSPLLAGPKVATLQTVSGSGAVHIAALFIRDFYNSSAKVYVSNPSWSNHRVMFEFVGFEVKDYPYYDDSTRSVAFDKMLDCMKNAEEGSVWILHPCAHNPTGCDLTQEQWKQVGQVMKERKLLPVLDCAYQGFASGDLDRDGWTIRHMLEEVKLDGLVCQSFSKSMGLYGERVGALHVVLPTNDDPKVIESIESQLTWLSRKEISTAARYGATIAGAVLSDPKLYAQWREDMKTMSGRIQAMRKGIVDNLKDLGTPGDWKHVTDQIGMFSYTGLTKEQVHKLREKHIYMADNGRMTVSGLNSRNIKYFCECVDEAVRQTAKA